MVRTSLGHSKSLGSADDPWDANSSFLFDGNLGMIQRREILTDVGASSLTGFRVRMLRASPVLYYDAVSFHIS